MIIDGKTTTDIITILPKIVNVYKRMRTILYIANEISEYIDAFIDISIQVIEKTDIVKLLEQQHEEVKR